MARKSIKVMPKKRGRPATGKDPLVAVRLPKTIIKAIDAKADAKGVTRSQEIRRMILKDLA
jgi:predicted DNA binding CopG/RHH family protein